MKLSSCLKLTICSGDIEAAGEARIVGEEGVDLLAGQGIDRSYVRAAAGPGSGEDILVAVAVAVNRCDAHAAGECRAVSEIAQQCGAVEAAECGDVGPAAGTAASDDVAPAVAVHVAGGYEDPSGKAGVISEKAEQTTA